MKSISYSFRIAHNTVSGIIKETCEAIWECLHEEQLKQPSTQDWLKISSEFESLWNMPHCIGAMDGKHIVIQVKLHQLLILIFGILFIIYNILGSSKIRISVLQL